MYIITYNYKKWRRDSKKSKKISIIGGTGVKTKYGFCLYIPPPQYKTFLEGWKKDRCFFVYMLGYEDF